jgi:hypothetical protein
MTALCGLYHRKCRDSEDENEFENVTSAGSVVGLGLPGDEGNRLTRYAGFQGDTNLNFSNDGNVS